MDTKKIISVLMSFLMLTGIVINSAFSAKAATMKLYGIDVSSYQGVIDWQKVKDSGIKFAILRVGTSKGKDSKFETNYAGAKAVGMPIGLYYYSYASTSEKTRSEANTVLSWISGKQFEYPLYFDIEDSSLLEGLTRADRTNLCIAFNSVLESSGFYTGVYANKNWFDNYLDYNTLSSKYAIWYAQYFNSGTDSRDFSSTYPMWQYSSSGSVDGIKGNVDLDVCYVDYPTMIKNLGKNNLTSSQPVSYSNGYYSCTASSLNIRSGPGTSFSSIGTMTKDSLCAVVDFNADYTWANIIYNGINGWSSMSYLNFSRAFPTLSVEYLSGDVQSAVPENTKVAPFTSITVPGELIASGYEFKGWSLKRSSDGLYFSGSSWKSTPTQLAPGTSYIADENMFSKNSSSETFTFTAMWNDIREKRTGWFEVSTASSALNIRSGPSTSYPVVGSVAKGSYVVVSDYNSDYTWAKVTSGNTSGWCSAQYLNYLKSVSSYTVRYDTCGSDTSYPIETVEPFGVIKIPKIEPEYEGFEFCGWTLMRMSDGKYYQTDGTWKEDLLGEKMIVCSSDSISVDQNFTEGSLNSDMYILKAVWNEKESLKYGDVDFDGEVCAVDLKIMIRLMVGAIDADELAKKASDLDGDGELTAVDIKLLKQYFVGYIEIFPVEKLKQ